MPSHRYFNASLLPLDGSWGQRKCLVPCLVSVVWPKAGETWVFTGVTEAVQLYRSAEGTEWVNEMTCRSQSERRMVTIISALPQQNMVEIRGTDKLKFVKGWTRMVDDDGNWLLEQAPMK
eukprot:Skav202986  [mRNA]  locus=scaffold2267:24288:31069:- [translate_table: standard]